MPFMGLKDAVILKVREKRKHHLSTDICDHELAHDQTKVLNGSDATCASIADKAGGFVVPFRRVLPMIIPILSINGLLSLYCSLFIQL